MTLRSQKMNRWFTALWVCMGASVWAAPACPPKPVSFLLFEAGLLYSEKTNDGIDKAVAEELARRSKCTFEFSVKPRARIWIELERGDAMMTGSALRTEEREAYAWAINYFGMKAEMMVSKGNGVAPRTRDEFLRDESLKMGATRAFKHGDAMEAFIEELRQKNRVVDVPPSSIFEMLVRGRYAAVPVYPLDSNYRDNLDTSRFTVMTDWFPTDKSLPRALLLSKKQFTKAQAQEWKTLVQQMKDDGTLRRIYTKYTSRETADKLMQFPPDPPW